MLTKREASIPSYVSGSPSNSRRRDKNSDPSNLKTVRHANETRQDIRLTCSCLRSDCVHIDFLPAGNLLEVCLAKHLYSNSIGRGMLRAEAQKMCLGNVGMHECCS